MSDAPAPEPWERQANESEEAWLAFRVYRDMVPDERKIRHAAIRDVATVSRWFRDHCWEERCRAFDAKFDAIRVEERERIFRRKAQDVAIDHMVMLSDARELVTRELAKWTEASRDTAMHGLLKPGEITRLLEVVVKADRLVRGETTENIGKTDLDVTKLSLDELDQLNGLLKKAGMKTG